MHVDFEIELVGTDEESQILTEALRRRIPAFSAIPAIRSEGAHGYRRHGIRFTVAAELAPSKVLIQAWLKDLQLNRYQVTMVRRR